MRITIFVRELGKEWLACSEVQDGYSTQACQFDRQGAINEVKRRWFLRAGASLNPPRTLEFDVVSSHE